MHKGTVTLSASVTVLNPRAELDDLVNRGEYAMAIVRAATFIEYFASRKIGKALQQKQIFLSEETISNLNPHTLILFLYALGLVDQGTFGKLMRVRKVRNRLLHRIGKAYSLSQQNALDIIEIARECIDILRS